MERQTAITNIQKSVCHLLGDKKGAAARFCDTTGLPPAVMSTIKRGTRLPDLMTLIVIADHYNVSIDYLVGRQEGEGAVSNGYKNGLRLASDALKDMAERLDQLRMRD